MWTERHESYKELFNSWTQKTENENNRKCTSENYLHITHKFAGRNFIIGLL